MTAPPPEDGAPSAPASRTQEERSRVTRLRVLEATVDCLVERGWAGTTTTVVAERAGVSRGAQLHHYRTKSDLVVAAVSHLAERRAGELRRAATADPPEDVPAAVDLLASLFAGPLYAAAMEIWVAARTDPALRDALLPLETRLGRETHRLALTLLGADESRPGVREAVQATLDLLRGLGVAALLTDDTPRRTAVLSHWSHTLAASLRADPTLGADLDVAQSAGGVSTRTRSRSAGGDDA